MFKLKNILQLSALMFFVMSCDDYLETPPADLMTSDGFYQTPSQSEQGQVSLYPCHNLINGGIFAVFPRL